MIRVPGEKYLLLILAVVSMAIYFNSLNAEKFIVDDVSIIEEFIQSDYTFYDIIRVDEGRTYKTFYDASYRPLFGLSLWIDFSLWFDGVRGYHITNIFFHVLNVILLFYLSLRLWRGREDVVLISFTGALLFAIHPIHTESVDWISGRQDPMATLFVGLSLLLYIKWKELKSLYYPFCITTLFFLGLFSREIAFVLIPILVVYELLPLFSKDKSRDFSGIYKVAILVPLLLFSLFIFNSVQQQYTSTIQSSSRFGPLLSYFSETGFISIAYENMAYSGYYLSKLVFPCPLNYATVEINIPFYFFFAVISLSSLFVLFKKERVLLFLSAATLLSILPNLPARFFAWTVVAERYLYLPSLFFCTGAGFLLIRFIRLCKPQSIYITAPGKSVQIFSVVAIFVFMASLTLSRNNQWNSNYRFWKDAVKKSPGSAEVLMNYAGVLGGNYVNLKLQKKYDSLLKRAPGIKKIEPIPGNGYDGVEKIVEEAAKLGNRNGYLILAEMGKADKDPEKVMKYLKEINESRLKGGSLRTYAMLFVYLSKSYEGGNEEELVLSAIKYLKKYVAYKRRDDAISLKIARLYLRISMYKEARKVVALLLKHKNLSFIQKRAAMRLMKRVDRLEAAAHYS